MENADKENNCGMSPVINAKKRGLSPIIHGETKKEVEGGAHG
jgi:hypothetical protein